MSFSSDYDNGLPIVLFVGQHFSGSLFEWVHLSILTRERTKETRARELGAPSPYLLGSLKCYTKTGHKGVEKQKGEVYNKRSRQI